ncbi:MAG: hypothetical protein Q9181_002294 [Wetmoreana brouardii]
MTLISLTAPHPSHGGTQAPLLNRRRSQSDNDTLPTVPNESGNQQQPAQVKRPKPEPSGCSDEDETLVRLSTNRNGSPGNLAITTHSSLAGCEKSLLEALAPLVRQEMQRSSGKRAVETPATNKSSRLTSKVGRVQHRKLHTTLPVRKKRRHSRTTASSWKRLKADSIHSSEMSMCPTEAATPDTAAAPFEFDGEHVCDSDESDDDDDGEPLLEEAFETVRVDSKGKIAEYYRKAFAQIGQLQLKTLLKAWIKLRQPRKQTENPYNGRKSKPEQARHKQQSGFVDDNPGRDTAPDWWPMQDGWRNGKGCRHKEPDHTKKPERLILAPILLRFTGRPGHPANFTVPHLKQATDSIESTPQQWETLNDLYNVREQEQRFEQDEIDGDTLIYVRKVKPQPPRSKKKPAKKPRKAKKLKQKCRVSPSFLEQRTPTQIPSAAESATSSLNSSFSSIGSARSIKREHPSPVVGYGGSAQASFDQYRTVNIPSDLDPMIPDPSIEFSELVATAFQAPHSASMAQMVTNSSQGIPVSGGFSSGQPMALQPADRGRTSSRFDTSRPPRPASVLRQESSSYEDGVIPRTVGFSWDDDMIFGFKPPIPSSGRPLDDPSISFTLPNNHPHGQPARFQRGICAAHRCPNSHSHGWRDLEVQRRICAEHGCDEDPRSHEMIVDLRPREQFQPNRWPAAQPADLDQLMEFNPPGPSLI